MSLRDAAEKAEGEFSALYSRMDTDRALYYLEEYQMRNPDGSDIPYVYNVTLNDPYLFAERAIAILSGANQQIVVESDSLADKQMSTIENFLQDYLYDVDERLMQRAMWELWLWLCQHICMRGWVGARVTPKIDNNGDLVGDVVPWDMRFAQFEFSGNGLAWAGYKMKRSAQLIEQEYGKKLEGKKEAEVRDLWSTDVNEVYVDGELIRQQKNPWGFVPVVIVAAPSGSMLQDEGNIKHRGESIYAANRDLYPEMNRMASVLQTLTMESFKPSMQYKSAEGHHAEPPDRPPFGAGVITPVDQEGGFAEMPMPDVHNAARLNYAMLEGRLQRGSLPAVDFGNLTFPLSAVAIKRLGEAKNNIFIPRLQGMSLFMQQVGRMVIAQFKTGRIEAKTGASGKKHLYKPSELEGDYDIRFKYYATSPEENVANYSIAAAAREFLDEDTILTDIIKVQSPDEVKSKRRSDLAEKSDPGIALYRYGHSLIDEERYVEARMVLDKLVTMLRMRQQQPEQEQTPQEPGTKPQELVPLMGGGKGRQEPVSPEGLARKETSTMPSEENR